MQLTIETELETDGRWIAEVLELPGALVYGATESEARARAQALARANEILAGEQRLRVEISP